MKKIEYGKQIILRIILISGIVGLIMFVLAVIITDICQEKRLRGAYVFYDAGQLSSNENYIGIIDDNNDKVSIVNKEGKEISHLETKGNHPNQIALGKDSYFLLYLWEGDNDDDARIVQYDYLSDKINESMVTNIASIACRDGYLFVGKWSPDEYDDEDDKGYYPFFEAWYNGFYANQYVAEKQFGSGLHDLIPDDGKRCRVGDVDFYYHEKGYFSTEPEWGDYPGTSEGTFWFDDKSRQADTKQERKNRTQLLKKVNGTEYEVAEYQVGDTIYGVCNIYENGVTNWPNESEDVLRSCCYKIVRETDELEIMSQADSRLGIVASDAVFVYMKDNVIIRQNIETGVEEVLYQFQNIHREEIYPQGDYLLVVDDNKCMPVLWNAK